MEIPNKPELNLMNIEEKKKSAKQQNPLSKPDIHLHFNFDRLGKILFIGLILCAITLFLFNHVIGHDFEANRQITAPSTHDQISSK